MIGVQEARNWLAAHCARRPGEVVPLGRAADRVLAQETRLAVRPVAPVAVMDGFAVRAADTEGASEYAPLPVAAAWVTAGRDLPDGFDSVLPPHCYEDGAAITAIGLGSGVCGPGHDVAAGSALSAGTVLTPLHLALLEREPAVFSRPRVAAPSDAVLHALVAQAGAEVVLDRPDLVLLTEPSGTVHAAGIAIRPGEGCAIGLVDGVPALLLPRHEAEAATVFAVLVAPLLRSLGGLPEPRPVRAALTRKISSGLGMLEAFRVRLEDGMAVPLGPALGIGLLDAAGAHGMVLVPEGSEGYPAGAIVPIFPL